MRRDRRRLLLVEADKGSRTGLTMLLESHGYDVVLADCGRSALGVIRREGRDGLHVAIVEQSLSDMDGLAVLDAILESHPGLPAIVMSGAGSIESAVEAMRRGAIDFLAKPFEPAQLLAVLDRTIAEASERGTVRPVPSKTSEEMARLGMIGYSRPMLDLFETTKRIARLSSTVLLLGESGTGKELIARALHSLGARAAGQFVPVNCATLSDQILENELFGHERGAFTSADRLKPGVMELADKGTLFLDEVNEMGIGCQAKLLRAIERREFRRVGGTTKIKVDLTLIAAANVNLEEWVRDGRFRADLFYRLKVVTLTVPPLRDREEAIPVLAKGFLDEIARNAGLKAKQLTPGALAQLVRYAWPGNVRELRNCMESLTLMVAKPVIDVEDLPVEVRGARTSEIRLPIGVRIDEAEKEIIRRTLETSPTIKEAAKVLGIGLRTLHTKIRKYRLRPRPDARTSR